MKELEYIICEVTFPHCREFDGVLFMLEPLFSGHLQLPNDEETEACIKRGWLRIID